MVFPACLLRASLIYRAARVMQALVFGRESALLHRYDDDVTQTLRWFTGPWHFRRQGGSQSECNEVCQNNPPRAAHSPKLDGKVLYFQCPPSSDAGVWASRVPLPTGSPSPRASSRCERISKGVL